MTKRQRGIGGGGYVGIAVLVASLGGVVWWSLPRDEALPARLAPSSPSSSGAEAAAPIGDAGVPLALDTSTLRRPMESTCELAILTEKSEDEAKALSTPDLIAKMLDVKYCGDGCDAVKKTLTDKDLFDVEVTTAEEYILPARDVVDVTGATMTESERASAYARPTVIAIKTHGPPSAEHMAMRSCFAAVAAISESIGGIIYDETLRRFENPAHFRTHLPMSAPGKPAFSPDQIVIQLYKQDDGTARLLSLGMERFGSPDLSIRGASMTTAPVLAHVLNAVAAILAGGRNEIPVTVTLADVARAAGKTPEQMTANAAASKPVRIDIVHADRAEADPNDNEMVNLVPPGNDFDKVVADLFGTAPPIVLASFDKELQDVAERARKSLPGAIARFQAGEGSLFVKGSFPVPPSSRADGGPTEEWLWVEAATCNSSACSGTLTTTPGYATNLSPEKPVRVYRDKASDWLLQLRDGGTAGGASIKVLERRPR